MKPRTGKPRIASAGHNKAAVMKEKRKTTVCTGGFF